MGATYVVIAPEHKLLDQLVKDKYKKIVDEYKNKAKHKSEVERSINEKEKIGVFTGTYLEHPLTKKALPLWIADYVTIEYGTGAANLMRPAMYGSYHHITIIGKENKPNDYKYDITGDLCENIDKFAIDRMLPKIDIGDYIVIHDTGAHGPSMGYNYNGKLRSAEILLKQDKNIKLIRRTETPEDYFATLQLGKI